MPQILMLTPSYHPRIGGVEQHVWQISQQLIKHNWSVRVLTERFKGQQGQETIRGVKVSRFSYPQRRFLGLLSIWWQLATDYWQLIKKADVIHIHDVFIWYLPLRLLLWGKPVVTTFHGWEGIYPVPVKNIFIRQLGNLLSNKTIAVGKYLEQYYHFKADLVIYGAVTAPRKLPRKKELLLYVGRLDYDTGLPVLLQSLQAGSWSGKVVFCGDGLLREQAELVGEVKGFVDPRPYLKQAKVVFGGGYLSILEAMAYRCLVFVAEKNPLKRNYYLLAPFAGWLNLVNSPKDLTRQLKSLKNQKLVKNKLDQAEQWAKGQSWQKLTDQYEEIYKLLGT